MNALTLAAVKRGQTPCLFDRGCPAPSVPPRTRACAPTQTCNTAACPLPCICALSGCICPHLPRSSAHASFPLILTYSPFVPSRLHFQKLQCTVGCRPACMVGPPLHRASNNTRCTAKHTSHLTLKAHGCLILRRNHHKMQNVSQSPLCVQRMLPTISSHSQFKQGSLICRHLLYRSSQLPV